MDQPFARPARVPSAPRFQPPTQEEVSAIQTALQNSADLKTTLRQRFGTEVGVVQTAVIAATKAGVFDLETFAANLGKSPDQAREMFDLIKQSGATEQEQALAADAGGVGEKVTAMGAGVIESGEK